jgi:hypothetical protein
MIDRWPPAGTACLVEKYASSADRLLQIYAVIAGIQQ